MARDPSIKRNPCLKWAGYNVARLLNPKKFQTVLVSPRSYFVFTPLLASTAVGTLEFRNTLEPVRSRRSAVQYFQGWADDVNFNKKTLTVEEATVDPRQSLALTHTDVGPKGSVSKARKRGEVFDIAYDKLVVAVGCYSQTFNIKGVREHSLFLKDVGDARKIRKRILECFETASLPSTPESVRTQILKFAIVGGGPTGVEFAAELYDLCMDDLARLFPDLAPLVRITLYDVAPNILSMFDKSLSDYATTMYSRRGISVRTSSNIQELRKGLPGMNDAGNEAGCLTLKTKEEGEVGIGMCVWSTGLMMNPFVQKALNICHTYPTASAIPSSPPSLGQSGVEWALKRHPKSGGLIIDERFNLKLVPKLLNEQTLSKSPEVVIKDVFAIGDVSSLEKGPLPATAQVANQQSKWLAKRLNKDDLAEHTFDFKSLGIMTYLGNMKAIMQTGKDREITG
ncbi:hypothetical protein MMC09_004939 [Bachmanniomyces sp. S44760]|nr:hypothetical protein [Bachmanniomyces sp. S44760]